MLLQVPSSSFILLNVSLTVDRTHLIYCLKFSWISLVKSSLFV